MMQITIVGAGAIGGTVGAFLDRQGEDVLLVDEVKEHVDAINARGLTITGRVEFTPAVRAVTPGELSGQLGWVFLAVKAQHTESALQAITPRLGPQGVVVSLQNGFNEVDYHVGELVRRGRARGLPMPLNTRLWEMIHEIEDGKRPMVPENLRELERMMT